jgi:hypothetical protein
VALNKELPVTQALSTILETLCGWRRGSVSCAPRPSCLITHKAEINAARDLEKAGIVTVTAGKYPGTFIVALAHKEA